MAAGSRLRTRVAGEPLGGMNDDTTTPQTLKAALRVGGDRMGHQFFIEVDRAALGDPLQVAAAVVAAGAQRADYEHASVVLEIPDDLAYLPVLAAVTGCGHGTVDVEVANPDAEGGKDFVPMVRIVNEARRRVRTLPKLPEGRHRPESRVVVVDPEHNLFVRASDEELAEIRAAKHVVVVTGGMPLRRVIEDIALVAGLRHRPGVPFRYPWVRVGFDETTDINLGEYRSAGWVLTRDEWTLKASANLVEKAESYTTQSWVDDTRRAPIESVLGILGSYSADTEDGKRWRCVRPQDHTNGDRNPSMVVKDNKAQCFRCDEEPRDPVALTMVTEGCTPAEVAILLMQRQQAQQQVT